MGKLESRTIVIGAGHNGLVCAAYLARAGHQVTVLEASDAVGGAAVTSEFADGFKVSAGAHLLYGLAPAIWKELDLGAHGLSLAAENLDTVSLDPSGKHVRISGGAVDGVSQADRDAMQEYQRKMSRFAAVIDGLHERLPPRMGTRDRKDLLSLARIGWDIRKLGRKDMREFLRIAGINIFDVLQEHFESELLKGALSLDGTLGAFLGTRSNNSVFCALHRMSGGNRYAIPAGGMGAVSQAMAAAARAAGAELRTGSRVQRLLLDFDRVSGVELDNGEQIKADHVVSSADPKTTFLHLLGARHLEAGFAQKVANIRSQGVASKLHLALDGLPAFSGLDPQLAGQRLLVAPSLQYVEHAFNHAKYGEASANPVIEMTIPSLRDEGLAPAGKHVLSAVVQWTPHALKAGWDNEKQAFQERVLDLLERHAPGIRKQVIHAELLTPVDLEARFGMTGGHWHHAELSLDQFLMMRPVPGAAQYATPVNGLWLCGAGSHPGGGVMGWAGRNAAHALMNGA